MESIRPVRVPVAMAGIMLVFFIFYASLGMPVIALPRTVADLDGMALFSWAITAPGLTAAVVTLVFGRLSDLYGRRSILMVSLSLVAAGSALGALSQTMPQFIGARAIQGLGFGALLVLSFSVLADLFPPVERGKWAGLLNIAQVVSALGGPVLAGILTDTLGWRYVFWFFVPVAALAAVVVWNGVPGGVPMPGGGVAPTPPPGMGMTHRTSHGIDYPGLGLMLLASTVTMLALSWAGSAYAWGSVQIVGMLGLGALVWVAFLWVESRAAEPLLAPSVLRNRIFLTVSIGGTLSALGLQAVLVYLPLFLQGVQGLSATVTGQVMTPNSLMTSLMGIVGGLLLARFRRYRWMMIASYVLLTGSLFWMASFDRDTSVLVVILASSLCGVGLGSLPTINTLVVQNSAPARMMGQVTGANMFFVMIGMAMAPAILGSTMNSAYSQALPAKLPPSAALVLDAPTLAALGDPRVLLSAPAMESLRSAFAAAGGDAQTLFLQTIAGARASLEIALTGLFLLGAIVMVASLILVATIPEIPMAESSSAPAEEPEPLGNAQPGEGAGHRAPSYDPAAGRGTGPLATIF